MAVTTVTLSLTLSRAPRCGDNVSEPESPWSPRVRRDLHGRAGNVTSGLSPGRASPAQRMGLTYLFITRCSSFCFSSSFCTPLCPSVPSPGGTGLSSSPKTTSLKLRPLPRGVERMPRPETPSLGSPPRPPPRGITYFLAKVSPPLTH